MWFTSNLDRWMLLLLKQEHLCLSSAWRSIKKQSLWTMHYTLRKERTQFFCGEAASHLHIILQNFPNVMCREMLSKESFRVLLFFFNKINLFYVLVFIVSSCYAIKHVGFGCLCLKTAVLSYCQDMLWKFIVIENRLEHEGDSLNCQHLLKNVFLHVSTTTTKKAW